MKEQVTARAYSNIALVKYWGKMGQGNAPATPSISLSLASLHATVMVSRTSGRSDQVKLPEQIASTEARRRIIDYLDHWRSRKLVDGCFRVQTESSFPAAAGLASSAAAFAALARALSAFSHAGISASRLSRLARHGSGSAARSVTGGISALPAGNDPAARQLVPPGSVPWGMVVALVSAKKKTVSSREGMEACRKTSPFYDKWVKQASRDYYGALKAIVKWDLEATGRIMEANMLAMHSVMISARPSLIYWEPATLELVKLAGRMRENGTQVYATIDAGPNVALLCMQEDMKRVAARVRRVTGVQQVLSSRPAGPAELVDLK